MLRSMIGIASLLLAIAVLNVPRGGRSQQQRGEPVSDCLPVLFRRWQ